MSVTESPPAPQEAATEQAVESAAAPVQERKKGKMKLIALLVAGLAAGAAAGVFAMGALGGPGDAAAEVDPGPQPGPIVGLEPMTVNLANGHYLRIGVSFLVTEDADLESGKYGDELHHDDAVRLQDSLIALFGGRDAASLTTLEGREAAKVELVEAANEILDGQVLEVYYTELVMQ